MARAATESVASLFARRAARAAELAQRTPVAREPLQFAAGLLEVQAGIAAALEASHRERPLIGRFDQDAGRIVACGLAVVRFAAARGPEALAREARERASDHADRARARLEADFVGLLSGTDYLSRAMLRPYFEVLRAHQVAPTRPRARGGCPFCRGSPAIACRRGATESDGAARHLVCAHCGLEWRIDRIRCPNCSESDPAKLPLFQDETRPTVRLETCESCRCYVKSIDVSDEPRSVPEVDDLQSLSLDLWAREAGRTRLEPGLAGI